MFVQVKKLKKKTVLKRFVNFMSGVFSSKTLLSVKQMRLFPYPVGGIQRTSFHSTKMLLRQSSCSCLILGKNASAPSERIVEFRR